MTVKHCPTCSAPYHPIFHQGEHGTTCGPDLFIAIVREAIRDNRRIRARFFAQKATRLYPKNEAIGAMVDEVTNVFPGELPL